MRVQGQARSGRSPQAGHVCAGGERPECGCRNAETEGADQKLTDRPACIPAEAGATSTVTAAGAV